MHPSLTFPCAVSQNTAAALTGRSVRTWQRRVEQGLVERLGEGRTLVPFDALVPELAVAIAPADLPLLARADGGDATAQAELGALLALEALAGAAGTHAQADRGRSAGAAAALYFLQAGADQGSADAMHWLALLHAAGLAGGGNGHEGDGGKALALMWLARAAAHGHVIARAQLAGLVPGDGVLKA
ncbi:MULTISPECIES: hypothetical protein [Comamonas]|uniref:Sel1 repeat family protein n=1 Tax=Comamonas flocculans TaxID=2597701 RepID=A0A5B8RVK0_9BURK|nr:MULTISPECIES: hypothetical protein [Comamonas]QEA11807.1 hypothetical protein FOZ74_01455 [Comamonas flocculans]QXL84899.1 hypothetical protein KUD94_02585 [Comamonas sp. NLF-1-9]